MEYIKWLQDNWVLVMFLAGTAVPFVIGLASIAAKFTATPKDDEIIGQAKTAWGGVVDLLHSVALNPRQDTALPAKVDTKVLNPLDPEKKP